MVFVQLNGVVHRVLNMIKELIKTLFTSSIPKAIELTDEDHASRFQNQSFLGKIWRLRHYLKAPFVAVINWNKDRKEGSKDPLSIHLSMAIGEAELDMDFYLVGSELGLGVHPFGDGYDLKMTFGAAQNLKNFVPVDEFKQLMTDAIQDSKEQKEPIN